MPATTETNAPLSTAVGGVSSAGKVRVSWIDVARVVSIFFVMQSHTMVRFTGSAITAAVAVSIFFFLAGYFDTTADAGKRARRVGVFVAASVFWVWVMHLYVPHTAPETMSLWRHFIMDSGHLWFLEFLVVITVCNAVFLRLKLFYRLAVLLLLFAIPTSLRVPFHANWNYPCLPMSYAMFLYFCGTTLAQYYRPAALPELLLFGKVWWSRCVAALVAAGIMGGVFYAAVTPVPIVYYSPLIYAAGVWAVLCLAYVAEMCCPRAAAWVAAAGPATFLLYVSHPVVLSLLCTLRSYTFAPWVGARASVWAFLVLLIPLSAVVYRILRSRSRVLRVLFFGQW